MGLLKNKTLKIKTESSAAAHHRVTRRTGRLANAGGCTAAHRGTRFCDISTRTSENPKPSGATSLSKTCCAGLRGREWTLVGWWF